MDSARAFASKVYWLSQTYSVNKIDELVSARDAELVREAQEKIVELQNQLLGCMSISHACELTQHAVLTERNRIRNNIIVDQTTGAGDYSYAEDYADKIVSE